MTTAQRRRFWAQIRPYLAHMGRISVGAIVERRILCIIVQLRVEWGGLAASGAAPPQAGRIGMLGHECGLAARVKRGVWTSHDRPVMVAREHLGCQPHVRLDVFVGVMWRVVICVQMEGGAAPTL